VQARGLALKHLSNALYGENHIFRYKGAHTQQSADPAGGSALAGRVPRC